MEYHSRLNPVLAAGLHMFNGRSVTIDYIEDDGDWAVIDVASGTFITSSPFSAAEALMRAAWLAGGPREMDAYIAQALQTTNVKAAKRLI